MKNEDQLLETDTIIVAMEKTSAFVWNIREKKNHIHFFFNTENIRDDIYLLWVVSKIFAIIYYVVVI